VVDTGHAHPLGNDPEAHAVALLAGVGAVAGPVEGVLMFASSLVKSLVGAGSDGFTLVREASSG